MSPIDGEERLPLLYRDLAEWFYLLTPPEDYADEAAFYREMIMKSCRRSVHTVLELGSGGGNNASHLKTYFQLTLVDRSAEMLDVSRALNPECEHIQGDMRTTRLGRLFDAVSALIGVRGVIEYEAQAAIDLETYATEAPDETGSYPFRVAEENDIRIIKVRDIFTSIIKDIRKNTAQSVIAARFHNTVTDIIIRLCQSISRGTGLKEVALSGGVFQNRLLFRKSTTTLEENGFTVYTHRQVPCNDGGISLGQVVIANNYGRQDDEQARVRSAALGVSQPYRAGGNGRRR